MTQPRQALDAFTPEERRIIQRHRTPEQVQQFLRRLPYNWELQGDTLRSFRQVVRHNTAHCLEAALVAAVILEQHGYPPLVVSFESKDGVDHVIHVFRQGGRWGAVARSRDAGLHGRKPVFRGIRDLVWSYFDPYVDLTGRITGYQLVDLRALGRYDWRLAPTNMWKVENYLLEIPHRKLRSSNRRYLRLLARFREYRRQHPRGPVVEIYRDRQRWM
ncbi:MAG: hypothetical protein E6I04_15565 [Chloroflexi bacterium]|nr:MAG: hypothetical protein E6I92_02090 [Chloroflexota bacterium]TMF92952.1 MAG: hypothetical protein E6I04_15565 [Chloroflexota bacterium]